MWRVPQPVPPTTRGLKYSLFYGHPAPSVLALAKSLGRQYRRVHEDVEALASAGLVDKGEGGLSATYDVLRTDMVL
jgi:predicted transcriptional regulator